MSRLVQRELGTYRTLKGKQKLFPEYSTADLLLLFLIQKDQSVFMIRFIINVIDLLMYLIFIVVWL